LDPTRALFNKSTIDLVRTLAILKVCGFQWLVKNSEQLLKVASVTGISKAATNEVLRQTFLKQFCAGETLQTAVSVLRGLRAKGIGGILDCAVEADVPESGYSSTHLEDSLDKNVERLLESIKETGKIASGSDAFVAVKLTALANPVDLKLAAELIVEASGHVDLANMALPPAHLSLDAAPLEARMLLARGEQRLRRLAAAAAASDVQLLIDAEQTYFQPAIDCITLQMMKEFNTAPAAPFECASMVPSIDTKAFQPMIDVVTLGLFREVISVPEASCSDATAIDHATLNLMKEFNKHPDARDYVPAYGVDEDTFFQPAIDAVTLDLLKECDPLPDNTEFHTPAESNECNKSQGGHKAVVFATYQAYLVGTEARMEADLAWAQANNLQYGVKLVRGAYMSSESKLAEEAGRPSPICESLQATHDSYNNCLRKCVVSASSGRTVVVLATHNLESVWAAAEEMERAGVQRGGGGVQFGQLYGMADHISYSLGSQGYRVAKYLPYGPVDEVMPYLIRRAQENSTLLAGTATKVETDISKKELARRWKNNFSFASSASA